jgi:hypothetical protein
MKAIKTILIFLLFSLTVSAQIRQDIPSFYRGDSKNLIFTPFSIADTATTYRFAMKASDSLTAQRRIYKATYDGITYSYNASTKKVTLTIAFDKTDTWGLAAKTYLYDIEAVNKADTNKTTTVLYGNFVLKADILTPFDNTDYLTSDVRYFPVSATSFDEGEFIKKSGTTFVGDSLLNKADTSLSNVNVSLARTKLLINNVDNTSDANKPISTATQTALNQKRNISDSYSNTETDSLLGTKQNSIPYTTANADSTYKKSEVNSLLSTKFNAADFGSYFDSNLAGKTLDNISAGSTNVHLTTSLKSNYDLAYAHSWEVTGNSVASKDTLPYQIHSFTTAQRDSWTPANGWLFRNSTLGAYQVYESGWQTLASGEWTTANFVPLTRTINGYDLSSNRSLKYSDLVASKIDISSDSLKAGNTQIRGELRIIRDSPQATLELYHDNGITDRKNVRLVSYNGQLVFGLLNDAGSAYISQMRYDGADGSLTLGSTIGAGTAALYAGNVVLGTSAVTGEGAIKYESGHFYGYDGSTWKQLDN